MSKLVFDGVVGSPPYDRAAELTGWRLAGGATHPVPTTGLQPLGVQLDGTAGYEADDAGSVHMGLQSWSVRLACQPDFDALAGLTATLIARGKGGPTAGDYWAWEVALAVAADGLTADVVLAWQDADAGTVQAFTLGTIERPGSARWIHLMVSREVVASGTYIRLVVNGELAGELGSEVTAGADVPATPGQTVTLGCRRNGAALERFFVGVLGPVEVLRAGQTVEQARHAYRDLLVLPELAAETYRLYSAHDYPPTRNSLYERYRVIPMGASLATVDDAVETRLEASLPDTAYGSRLEAWEAALGFTGAANLSLAERQERVAAAIALAEGISRTFLGAYAYSLINGVVPVETDLLVQYEELAGLQFQYLWVGQDADLVAGASLTASGGATDGQAPMRETLHLGSDVFRFAGAADEVFAATASVAELEDTDDILLVIGFYVAGWPAANSVVCGKQDLNAPLPRVGYQLFLLSTGEARFDLSDDLGGVVQLTLSKVVAGWNVITIRSNRLTNLITVDDGYLQLSTSSAGRSYGNVEVFRLGDSRIARPEPSFPGDVRFFGVARGAHVRAVDTRALTRRMRAALGAVYEQQNDILVDFRARRGSGSTATWLTASTAHASRSASRTRQ